MSREEKSDPLKSLLAQLLVACKTDMLALKKKSEALISSRDSAASALVALNQAIDDFTTTLTVCQDTAHFMYDESADDIFDQACNALGRDPDAIRNKVFEGLPQSLVKMVVSGKIPNFQ